MSVATKDMGETAGETGGGALKGAILIAGPTASGKSGLALRIAAATGGTIVNADSMQVYGVLRVLTARPSPEEEAQAPHVLYGHVDPATLYSTGAWLRDVAGVIASARSRPLIFVGGTGLYFEALTRGLSRMPDIPQAIRDYWRQRLAAEGAQHLHKVLRERDEAVAERLRQQDGQRIVRALEVLEASGRSILRWQEERGAPLVDATAAQRFVLAPPRAELSRNIAARLASMLRQGAVEEVHALRALDIDPQSPAMKAIGVPELGAGLDGAMSMDEAVEATISATRRYAKRQETWMRNRFDKGWQRFESTARIAEKFGV